MIETNTAGRGFRTREVAELTGLSLRQLQVWDERGLLVPARVHLPLGHWREYSAQQVRTAQLAAIIRSEHIRPRKALRLAEKILTEAPSSVDKSFLVDFVRECIVLINSTEVLT